MKNAEGNKQPTIVVVWKKGDIMETMTVHLSKDKTSPTNQVSILCSHCNNTIIMYLYKSDTSINASNQTCAKCFKLLPNLDAISKNVHRRLHYHNN